VDLSLGLQDQLASLFGGVVDNDSNADAEFERSIPSSHPSDESRMPSCHLIMTASIL
jgi:hypothetical protein